MLHALLQRLAPEISGQACFDHLLTLTRHHRIQASPGYRAAAEECLRILQGSGVMAQITTYPATGRNQEWTSLTPQEWACREAELWLLSEDQRPVERLAWYGEMPISIIQRSTSADATAQLVVIDNPESPESWVGDLAGKIALVGNDDIHRIWAYARRAGVIGLITDRMTYHPPVRPEGDLADERQYTSFWWAPEEPKGWGFVITPRQGARLRRAAAAGPIWLKAGVDARFYDGTIENVEAVLPGEGPDEVLILSHLCHPKPSANDNASGPSACMEAARALQKLIGAGALPTPRRTIRFIFVPEMTGTYAFLANRHDQGQIAAALNVDMVGEDQSQTGSTLHCEHPPLACPSFAGDLMAAILAEVATGDGGFRYDSTAFSGGSDHIILSDPLVGVPCPMLIQWPDRYYHTTADTPARSDPAMLRRVGLMIAAYAYFAAAAGPDEVTWLGCEMAAAFPGQLHRAVAEVAEPEAVLAFRVERKLADLGSLNRLLGPDAQEAFAPVLEQLSAQVEQAGEMERERIGLRRATRPAPDAAALPVRDGVAPAPDGPTSAYAEGWLGAADLTAIRPERVLPGPVRLKEHLGRLAVAELESWHAFTDAHRDAATERLDYWADGQRSLAEICRLIELETGHSDRTFALGYFQLLVHLELVRGV